MHKYERFGLIAPARMGPIRRLYSEKDIKQLCLIKQGSISRSGF
ncbi:MAG: MerR family transcriptional regulator [Dehalococcoidia bacterium]|nr:MerR family transcriptional regulator [Dehalococcoidia bacterium]